MRKVLYILAIFVACSVITVGMTLAFLHSATVQTGLVRLATDELSYALGTHATVGGIRYRFPAKLEVNDLYLEDQQGDTLLSVGLLYAHFSPKALLDSSLLFYRIDVEGVRSKVYKVAIPDQRPPSPLEGEERQAPERLTEWNYQFLVDAFAVERQQEKDTSKVALKFRLPDVFVYDIRGEYEHTEYALKEMRIRVPYASTMLDSIRADVHLKGARYADVHVDELVASGLYNDTTIDGKIHLKGGYRKSGLQSGGYKHDYVTLDAGVSGNLDSLATENVRVTVDGTPVLDAAVTVKGLRDIKTAYVRAECRDLTVRPTTVQDIISSVQQRPFRLSPEVHRLGEIHYRGLLEGPIKNLKLQGAFRTKQGTVTTDAWLSCNEQLSEAEFSGKVGTERFHLGKMLANSEIGNLSAEVSADVHFEMHHRPVGVVRGSVRSFEYRGYAYSRLDVLAAFEEDGVEGKLNINDENGELMAEAKIKTPQPPTGGEEASSKFQVPSSKFQVPSSKSQEPSLKGEVRLRNFRPRELRLSEQFGDMEADMSLRVDMRGGDLNNLNGYVSVDSVYLKRPDLGDSLLIKEIRLEAESEGLYHRMMLTSDLGTGRLEGLFDYGTLETTALKMGVRDLPSLFRTAISEQKLKKESNNEVDLYLYGREIEHLQYILDLPVRVGNYPVLKFYVDEELEKWGLQGYLSEIRTEKQALRDITLSAHNEEHGAHLDASAEFSNGIYTWHNVSWGDTISSSLIAIGDSSLVQGELSVVTAISQYNRRPLITAEIGRGSLVFNDTTYYVEPSEVTVCMADTSITFSNFRAGTMSQYVGANGVLSHHAWDKLEVGLGNIDAGYIVSYLLPEKTLTVGGRLTGTAELYGILDKPRFGADVLLKDMSLNGCRFGDASVQVSLSEDGEQIRIGGYVTDDDDADATQRFATQRYATQRYATRYDVAHVKGAVDLGSGDGSWSIDIQADSVPLGFIEHWTSSFLQGIEGRATGHVTVGGRGESTYVTAEVLPHDASVLVPVTGCRYYLSDSCYLDSTSIRFPHLTVRDEDGNPIQLNGVVEHRSFMDFHFGIDIHTDRGMVINLPENSGETLQGKVYAHGDVRIAGDDNLVRLDATAETAKNSKFRLSLGTVSNASGQDFIHFVDHNIVEQKSTKPDYTIRIRKREQKARASAESSEFQVSSAKYQVPSSGFLLGLNIEANQNATVQLVLNEKTGDMIEAVGDGALQFTYDDKPDKYGLIGTYTINSGKMGFTLANTFRRNFTITDGSTIIFSGDPENPDLDVDAKYRVTASLRDLLGAEASTIAKARTSIPVDVAIRVTGKLESPVINFYIELPSADEAIRTQVASVINTEEMLMREVVYLVAFGRFYTPEYMSTNSTWGVNEGFSLLSSTITGQINSWLSKLTDRFSMGVNIRNENGFGNESEQEYEAEFQIQPISRIVINGNVGYRYSQVSTQPFYGDLDIEFLLTENGKLRLKGFTHMVDKYSMRQGNASTVQGIGFVFKHEWNEKNREQGASFDKLRNQSKEQRQDSTEQQKKVRVKRSYVK